MEKPEQTLSVITVSLNESGHLWRLKQALDRLQKPTGIQIESILVDGGSADGTAALARELGFSKVIELPGASIPLCRNRGVAEAGGTWLAFLDADCEPALDWLTQAAPWLGSGRPVILGWPVEPPPQRTWVQEAWHAHWLHKHPQVRAAAAGGVVRKEAFRLVTTRNMLLHREVCGQVGGFDENLPTGEDTDFVFRAYRRGIEVVAVPALRVIHHGEPATLGEFYRQQLWHANRDSYRKIVRESGAKVGGHAPLFAALFLAGLILLAAGAATAAVLGRAWPVALALPLLLTVGLPAGTTAARAKSVGLFLPLCLIYALYGLARALDLAGCARRKGSWKRN